MAEALKSYIAVDLETTGLNPKLDKIMEIGALKVIDGQVKETFSTFINPRRPLSSQVKELTGIRDEDLADAPGIEDVIADVVGFCGEFPLLGHHVIFDYSFLKKAAVDRSLSFEKMGIDTLSICRACMPVEEKKNLSAACAYFDIKIKDAHRALADCKAAHLLYQRLLLNQEMNKNNVFNAKPLIYKVKKDQVATKRQKDHLQDLLKYHRISLTVQIDYMSKNEISRLTDKIILEHGRINKRGELK